MPFVAERPLEDMVNPGAVTPAMRGITAAAGDALERETKARTPIYVAPMGAAFEVPRARTPGTLRESVHQSGIRRVRTPLGVAYEIRVRTFDPVGPHVEWTTRPHEITPNPPKEALRFFWRGRVWVLKRVHHPGTEGQHMFARAAAWLEREVSHIAIPAQQQFLRDLVTPRLSVVDRTGRGRAADELTDTYLGFFQGRTIGFDE